MISLSIYPYTYHTTQAADLDVRGDVNRNVNLSSAHPVLTAIRDRLDKVDKGCGGIVYIHMHAYIYIICMYVCKYIYVALCNLRSYLIYLYI